MTHSKCHVARASDSARCAALFSMPARSHKIESLWLLRCGYALRDKCRVSSTLWCVISNPAAANSEARKRASNEITLCPTRIRLRNASARAGATAANVGDVLTISSLIRLTRLAAGGMRIPGLMSVDKTPSSTPYSSYSTALTSMILS